MTSQSRSSQPPATARPPGTAKRLLPYVWAVAAVCVGVVLRSALAPLLGERFLFATLLPGVIVVAYLAGLGPAVFACMLSVLAVLFLLRETIAPGIAGDPAIPISVTFFIISGLVAGFLGDSRLRALRRAAAAIRAAETETARVEEETLRAEEEAARAEEEKLRAEEAVGRAEQEATRAARESDRVERILASITDAFIVLDRNWRIAYLNERAAALAGRTPADCAGASYWQVFPESTGGPFEKAFRRAVAGHQVTRAEAYSPSLGRWLEFTAYPSADGLTLVGQDVTDRVQAHEATSRLGAIVASSEDAILGKALDGTITSWNAAAERIFGYTAAEVVGSSIFRLIPPELHDQEREILRRVARGEPVEYSETERIRADGERISIALTVSPIRDGSGAVVGASSIKRDITAEKRIRAALALESARSRDLARALDATQAMVRDLDGRITYWSSGSARLYGWSAAEAVGRVSHELLRTEFPIPPEEIRAALMDRGQWEGELVHVAKNGRRVDVASQWVLQRDDQGEPVAVIEVNTDVTARRQADERLRQSERMEVVGQLAGGVAHEANNQMTVVLGATDFLLRRADLPPEARQDLEQVRAAAERTAAITGQLLAFSRRQMMQPQVLELDEVVHGLEGVLRRTLGDQSTLVLRLESRPGRVLADPGQLAQVLINLVLNARDAMPVGGRLTVQTSRTVLTEHYAEQHPGVTIRPGRYAMLAVSDTGHGMSPETLRRIFEPFYTTKPIGRGTGLGLATVYGIVKQSDGYIWAYSELGQGTTMKIYLPLEPGPVPEALPAAAPPRGTGEVVLLVEDEPAVRSMTSRALQEHGYAVIEARNGHEALQVVERGDGQLHLLLTDLIMPGMDGTELARRVAGLRPDLPVLFMSGYTDDEIIQRGLLKEDQPFLQKPFPPEALVRRVAGLVKSAG